MQQQARDIDAGALVSALGALVLLVSLFLDWYDIGLSGWDAFETWDVVLALGAAAVLVAVLPLRPLDVRVPVRFVGAVALALAVLQLLNPPPAATGPGPAVGGWLALAGALAAKPGPVGEVATDRRRSGRRGRRAPRRSRCRHRRRRRRSRRASRCPR